MIILHSISLSSATFGIIANDRGVVIRAAPIAKWTLGKHINYVLAYYRRRGAAIMRLP